MNAPHLPHPTATLPALDERLTWGQLTAAGGKA